MSQLFCLSDGCEFIDDGGYGDIPPSIEVGHLYHLQRSLLRLYADPNQYSIAWSEDRSWLRGSIAERGITTPVELHIDPTGSARLREGHHRLCVAEELGISIIPTQVKLLAQPWPRGGIGVFLPGPTMGHLEEWLDILARKSV